MELIHALDLRHVVDVFSVDASSSIASARYMHTKKVEKKDLHQCTVLCHNEAQERHLLWLLDNEYLDLMRDPESTIFQGDELKAEIDETQLQHQIIDASYDFAQESGVVSQHH